MRHPDTSPKRFAVMLQSFLLGGVLIVASFFVTPELEAQTMYHTMPVTPAPAFSAVTQSTAPSPRQAGDLPELVWVKNEWCEEIEDFCPISDHDFGTVATGSSGLYLGLLLHNRSESLFATNLSIQSDVEFPIFPDFNNDCYGTNELPPGGVCRVRIKFAPTEPGPMTSMLMAVSAEGAETSLPLEGIGGSDRLLYGQFHQEWDPMFGFFSILNAIYTSTPESSSELADDFLVENPEGWTIHRIGFELYAMQFYSDIESFNVLIMADDGGVPSDIAVCSAPDSKIFFSEEGSNESRVELSLSSPCQLSPGHYWLRIHVHTEGIFTSGFYSWGLQYEVGSGEEPPGELPVHLNPPVWRNPGNDGGHGCTEWTSLYPPACGLEDFWPFLAAYGAIFWLIGEPGTVSNEGGPNDVVQGLTHPSPNPVRQTASFTLTVDRGQQVIVEVFDVMGRRVQVLYEGNLAAGATENLRLDASQLSSGIYVIRALAEDFVDTQRITVVR